MTHIRSALAAALLVLGSATVVSAQKPAHARGPGRRNPDAALMKGMSLSDQERTNLKNVHAKYADQDKAIRDQAQTQMANMRAARQRGDTAALRTLRQNSMAQRTQQRTLMQSERADLRGALSQANQGKFDANAKAMRARFGKHGKGLAKDGARQLQRQGPRAE